MGVPKIEIVLVEATSMENYAEWFAGRLRVPCHFRHDAPYVWWHRHQRRRIAQAEAGQIDLLTL